MSKREIGVGLIGLGFMGRTHLAAYRDAARDGSPCRVVALCDASEERFTGTSEQRGNLERESDEPLYDPDAVRFTTSFDTLLADPDVDLVSVCTPTDTHVALAAQALEAGKHVLVEKPLALSAAEAEHLAAVAEGSARVCMPAMCMRFWPGWSWLKERIDAGSYGGVRSAVFRRLGSPPAWSPDFYRDTARTGGALFDLHVHDADFVRWCFGDPAQVVTAGHAEHFTTLYRFRAGPPHVSAEAAWDPSPGFPFRMRYTVVFERATADYEHGRSPELLLACEGSARAVELPVQTGYDGEVRHLLDAVAQGASELDATLADALGVARLLVAERRSLAEGGAVSLPAGA